MFRLTVLLGLSSILLLSAPVHAQSDNVGISHPDRLGVAYGDTYAKQNIDTLNSSEVFIHKQIDSIQEHLPAFIKPMYEVNFGVLTSSGDQGYLMGLGPRLELRLAQKVKVAGAFRMAYLDRYKYRSEDGDHMRSYGGHRQFQYYWEAVYGIDHTFTMGYRWMHMSNGMQVLPDSLKYDHNPVIETHNLVLQFSFE